MTAAIGLSEGGAPRDHAAMRLPAVALLHPSAKPCATTARPSGHATSVTSAMNPSQPDAVGESPAPADVSRCPIHELGSHSGAVGSCSELMSPSMCAKRAKLNSQNAVGTAAPITHKISFAICGGMIRSVIMVMVESAA